MTQRVFFDSSSLIVLAEIGYLELFCNLVPHFTITSTVVKEVTLKQTPIKKIVEELIAEGKIRVHVIEISSHSEELQLYYNLGLHDGEISLLLAAKKEDVIVFDDLVARAVARAEGFSLTGLLGLLVSLKKAKKLSQKQALSILSAMNKTNFRMTALLYETIRKELEG